MFRYVQSLHRAHFILWRESPSEERRIKNRSVWVLRIRLKSGFTVTPWFPLLLQGSPTLSHRDVETHHSDEPRVKPKEKQCKQPQHFTFASSAVCSCALLPEKWGLWSIPPCRKWSLTILVITSNRVTLNFRIFKNYFLSFLKGALRLGQSWACLLFLIRYP